ncbi:MAG: methyltransferase [Elusimicrobiota bacterium]
MKKQRWTIVFGNILFKYRSYFFVPILAILIIFTKPQISFGSKIADIFFDIFGFTLALFGFFIRVLVIGYKKPGTSGRGTNIDVEQLVTDGMYQVCKNPLYLANFLMWLGLTIMWWETCFFTTIIAFFIIEYFFIIKAEEAYLSNKFGTVYDNYKKSVPVFLARLRKFKKPDRLFNWNKVLKNETNLLLLVLALPPLLYVYENKLCKSSGVFCILLEAIILIGWLIAKRLLFK